MRTTEINGHFILLWCIDEFQGSKLNSTLFLFEFPHSICMGHKLFPSPLLLLFSSSHFLLPLFLTQLYPYFSLCLPSLVSFSSSFPPLSLSPPSPPPLTLLPLSTHAEGPMRDDLGVLPKPPWREVSEQHGEPLHVNGRLLLHVTAAHHHELPPSAPKQGLLVAFLCVHPSYTDNDQLCSLFCSYFIYMNHRQ